MRKAISIFFLLIFSVSFTEAKQFLKFPGLVEHYNYHFSNDPETTFLAFLEQHYLSGHPDDGDDREDNQLPFKTADMGISTPVFLISPAFQMIQISNNRGLPVSGYRPPCIISNYSFSVFHPPRRD